MRLVFVTQRVDPADPVLGATTAKIAALAARVDEVVVLADSATPEALPDNCRVRPFASATRLGRGIQFERALTAELSRRPRPTAVIAHMCPIYAVLAAPLARPLGTRVLLWYAHWNRTRMLDAAVRASNLVISVDARSVPVSSGKVIGIGHGIEVADFACSPPAPSEPIELLALGRYSAAKGIETMVRAVALLRTEGLDARMRVHGTSSTPAEAAHLVELQALVTELGLGDSVELGAPVPRTEIPGLLARSMALVNNMRPGAPDKVVYEACASCRPVIVSNPLFDELLDDVQPSLRFVLDDPDQLADRVRSLAALDGNRRAEIGSTLRERVLARHSVDSWADAVVRLAAGGQPEAPR
jgi:glycosyltransferase involved in cell wall biosynthesis